MLLANLISVRLFLCIATTTARRNCIYFSFRQRFHHSLKMIPRRSVASIRKISLDGCFKRNVNLIVRLPLKVVSWLQQLARVLSSAES